MSQNKKENKDDINKPNTENKWSEFFYASIANFIYTIIWGLFSSSFIFYILIKLLKKKEDGKNLLEYYFPIKDEYYGYSTLKEDNVIRDFRNKYSINNNNNNNLYNNYLPLYNKKTVIDGREYYDDTKNKYLNSLLNFFSVVFSGVDNYESKSFLHYFLSLFTDVNYDVDHAVDEEAYKTSSKLHGGGYDDYEYENCDNNKFIVNIDENDIYKYNILQRWVIYSKNTVLKTISESLKFERENIINTIFIFFCKYIDTKIPAKITNTDKNLFDGKLKKIVFILSPLIILLIIIASIITNVISSIYYGFNYIISNSFTFLIFGGFIFPFITCGLIGFYTFFEILFMFTFFPLYKNYPKDNNLIQKIISNNKNVLIFIFSVLSIISSFDYLKLEISISMIVFCVLYNIKTMFF